MDCNIAHHPPENISDSSASRPRGSASQRCQNDLGAIKPALSFIYNGVDDYVELSKSYNQVNFAANTHRDFHLPRPNLAATSISNRYQTGAFDLTSPVRLQGYSGSFELPAPQGDVRSFGCDIRRSNGHCETGPIPRGHADETFLVSSYHSRSCYPSPATDTRLQTRHLTDSTDPLSSQISQVVHMGPSIKYQ